MTGWKGLKGRARNRGVKRCGTQDNVLQRLARFVNACSDSLLWVDATESHFRNRKRVLGGRSNDSRLCDGTIAG